MTLAINNTKIVYLATLDKSRSPGVYKKILGTIAGAEQAGYSSDMVIIDIKPGFLPHFIQAIDDSDGDILIIRSICQYNFYLIPALRRAKRRGKRIIMDVPTPNKVALKELAGGDSGWKRKLKDLCFLTLSGPIPFWYVSKVLQYAEEGFWFLFGNRKRTKVVGNGIQVGFVPMRTSVPDFDGISLNLICVASINYWHGIDRLIKAIAIFNGEDHKMKVHLRIVGDGSILASLVKLVKTLDVENYVTFLGYLEGDKLFHEYSHAHLAVGSLALFRKNLRSASELKSREYCAVGIPFIAGGKDVDFGQEAKFRIELPNRENIDDLVSFFRNFKSDQISFSPDEIRAYAVKNLDFSVKIKEMLHSFKL